MFSKAFSAVALVLALSGAGIAAYQDQKNEHDQKNEEAIRKYQSIPGAAERAKRHKEMLDDPSFLSAKLSPRRASGEAKGGEEERPHPSYKSGAGIVFDVTMTSTLAEPFAVPVWDVYNQLRPQLSKDGRAVPYSERTALLLKDRDELLTVISSHNVSLRPGVPQELFGLSLDDWYGPLEPGTYQLSAKYRFEWRGKWNEIPPLTFEVAQ